MLEAPSHLRGHHYSELSCGILGTKHCACWVGVAGALPPSRTAAAPPIWSSCGPSLIHLVSNFLVFGFLFLVGSRSQTSALKGQRPYYKLIHKSFCFVCLFVCLSTKQNVLTYWRIEQVAERIAYRISSGPALWVTRTNFAEIPFFELAVGTALYCASETASAKIWRTNERFGTGRWYLFMNHEKGSREKIPQFSWSIQEVMMMINLSEEFQICSPNIWGGYFALYEQNNPPQMVAAPKIWRA